MFEQLTINELLLVEGGKNWWKIIGGSILTIAGGAGVVVSPGFAGKAGSAFGAWEGISAVIDGWNE